MNGTNWYCICWDVPVARERKEQKPWIVEAFTAQDAVTQFHVKWSREGDNAAQILSIAPATISQVVRWCRDNRIPLS